MVVGLGAEKGDLDVVLFILRKKVRLHLDGVERIVAELKLWSAARHRRVQSKADVVGGVAVVHALHDLKVRVQHRRVERRARLARAAADHVHGLAVEIARRGRIAVFRRERRHQRAVLHRVARVEDVARDALCRQLHVLVPPRRAADARGVAAQLVAEQSRLQLLGRDLRPLDRRPDGEGLPRRRRVVSALQVGERKAHPRMARDDLLIFYVVARVDLLTHELFPLRRQIDRLRGYGLVARLRVRIAVQRHLERAAAAKVCAAQRVADHTPRLLPIRDMAAVPAFGHADRTLGRQSDGKLHRLALQRIQHRLRRRAKRLLGYDALLMLGKKREKEARAALEKAVALRAAHPRQRIRGLPAVDVRRNIAQRHTRDHLAAVSLHHGKVEPRALRVNDPPRQLRRRLFLGHAAVVHAADRRVGIDGPAQRRVGAQPQIRRGQHAERDTGNGPSSFAALRQMLAALAGTLRCLRGLVSLFLKGTQVFFHSGTLLLF